MKKKIYIAGAGGMLGEAFYRIFKDDYEIKCTDKDVNEKWLSFLDFRNFEKYKKDVDSVLSPKTFKSHPSGTLPACRTTFPDISEKLDRYVGWPKRWTEAKIKSLSRPTAPE